MDKNEIAEMLDLKIVDFFPKKGSWKSSCFGRSPIVSEDNLPCHLRNIDWLAALIMKKYDLHSLEESVVKEYVRDSLYFNRLRNEYEQRIVKWQIEFMLNGGEGWIVDSEYGGDFYCFNPMCDYAFRKGIVDTLLAIGMDLSAIEEGIEKNVDMWQAPYMNLAFNNKFNPICSTFRITPPDALNYISLKEVDPFFRECWLKYRKYQYYQEHKSSVETYGVVTPEMKISLEEAENLKIYLQEQERIRLEEIEEFKMRKSCSEFVELKEMSQSDFYSLSYEDCLPKEKNQEKKKVKGFRKVLRNIFNKNN